MVTAELHGDTTVVTILDDAGRDADLEVFFKEGGPSVTLRQTDPKSKNADVIVVTPTQAGYLMELLQKIIGTETATLQ
jgi:hypothetical protein